MNKLLSCDPVDSTYTTGTFSKPEAEIEVSKLRRKGIHAWSVTAECPFETGKSYQALRRTVLYRLPTIL